LARRTHIAREARRQARLVAPLLCLVAGACDQDGAATALDQPHQNAAVPVPSPVPFDFYVLALSWSPTWCDENRRSDPQQCDRTRPYGFVTHGLWPQFERGYPRSCDTRALGPDSDTLQQAAALYPNPRLARLQWERHGTCSGLDGPSYFAVTQAARDVVQVPKAFINPQSWQTLPASRIEAAFIEANPGLTPQAIAVEVRGNRLREVRVCLDVKLAYRACDEVDGNGIADTQTVRVPPTRASP
jgi:ribonuclease T2